MDTDWNKFVQRETGEHVENVRSHSCIFRRSDYFKYYIFYEAVGEADFCSQVSCRQPSMWTVNSTGCAVARGRKGGRDQSDTKVKHILSNGARMRSRTQTAKLLFLNDTILLKERLKDGQRAGVSVSVSVR